MQNVLKWKNMYLVKKSCFQKLFIKNLCLVLHISEIVKKKTLFFFGGVRKKTFLAIGGGGYQNVTGISATSRFFLHLS